MNDDPTTGQDEGGMTLSSPDRVSPVDELPRAIGDYRVVRKLGEGGMGIVYEAEQASPRRLVALKVIRGGPFVDETQVRMFERESQALARLKHPNIGAIYEAGRTATGQHFFAMELVVGTALTVRLSGAPLTSEDMRRRLELFRTICDAVHYAHQKGVIHRDLKPSNIVLTDGASSEPCEPTVKILDFGLARITDVDVRGATLTTEVGAIKGTLPYMSPEQTTGDPGSIDIRSDVYALGVILYEMLTGRRPYDLDKKSLVDALRIICEEAPRPIGRGTIGRSDSDLETIVRKALEKDPDRRYGTAAGLGADVGRYLTSQPILARPPSAAYQIRKFAARNKALVSGFVATMVVLLAGVVVSSIFGVNEARQRRAAERAGYVANVTAAEAGLRLFELAEVKRRLAACAPSLRGWEWRHLAFRAEMSERTLTGHTSRIYPVVVSSDGKLFVSGSADPEDTIRFWDAATGNHVRAVKGGEPTEERTGGVRSLAFSPDGRRLASASDDTTVRLWDVATGAKLLELRGHEDRVNAVAFTPDGREIVSASYDRTVRRWDAVSGRSLGILGRHDDQVWGMAVCADGSRIVSGGLDRTLRLWERSTGRELLRIQAPDAVMGVACSPPGDRLAAVLIDGTVRLYDARSGVPIGSPGRHDDVTIAVVFSPDGRMLATGSKDRTVRLWNAATGAALATLVGHDNAVTSVAFDSTGKRLISGSWDRTVRVWSADPLRTSSALVNPPGVLVDLAVTPDGSRILSGSMAEGIGIYDARSGNELGRIPNRGSPLRGFELSSDGSLVVAIDQDQTFRTWELGSGGAASLVHEQILESVGSACFVPRSSEMLLGSSKTGTIRRWNSRTGAVAGEIVTSRPPVRSLAVSRDGARLAVAGGPADWKSHGYLQLLDLRTGRLLAEREVLHVDPNAKIPNGVGAMKFSPDGTRLVTTHVQDFTVRLWDGRSLEPVATMRGHTEAVRTADFSPDGARLATGGGDYAVRLWDGTTCEPLLALRTGRLAWVVRVVFTPDGSTIVSAEVKGFGRGAESTIRLWRTHAGSKD